MTAQSLEEVRAQFVKSLDKTQLGAAASKLFAASIGDMVVVLSRSHAHKHHTLADIEWMIIPPITSGQFHIVEAAHKEHGFRGPFGAVTWAMVSEEVDARLRQGLGQGLGQRLRLHPNEWKSGAIGWLIDAVGHAEAVGVAFRWLKAGPFKEQPLNLATRDKQGALVVSTMDRLIAERTVSSTA
jgi:hemolysin-activating ACP:hemolysin acyltransferase